MSDLLSILLLSTLGSVVALVGGLIFLSFKKWSNFLSKYSTPFAAGVLMTAALIGMLPEAVHMIGQNAFLVSLLAFLGAYLFETLVCDLHHHDHEDDDSCRGRHASVSLIVVGDTIHNFIDGVAIAAAYLINPGLGIVTTASTFLHEVPHEIGDFGILLKAGYSRKKVFFINLFSALSTLVGALVVYFWAAGTNLPGILLAVAAGMFLYLGASDFLPEADHGLNKSTGAAVLLLGVVIMYLTLSAVPHSHNHDEHEHDQGEHLEDETDQQAEEYLEGTATQPHEIEKIEVHYPH